MNKRKSKKQVLQMQVNNLEDAYKVANYVALRTSNQLNRTIDRTDENFAEVAKEIAETDSNINQILDAQKRETSEVLKNRLAILDMQRQLKIARFIDLLLVITILFLSIRS